MDTRYWGPSGWRFLHLLVSNPDLGIKNATTFFMLLPYVLPCKYCRASLTDYYTADPIPTNIKELPHWLYRIHNCVNAKLREQNLVHTPDPSWSTVKSTYQTLFRTPCTQTNLIGYDFFYSVAFTTPCKSVPSSPLPNAPPNLPTDALKNRWGVLPTAHRYKYIERWWRSIPAVMPYSSWSKAFQKALQSMPPLNRGRVAMTKWIFDAERDMCAALQASRPHTSFQMICTELRTFSSNCGKYRPKARTCRSKQSISRTTLKKKRSSVYFATGGFL